MKDFEMKPTPLTDEQMRDIAQEFKASAQDRLCRSWDDVTEFARAIEAARDSQWGQMLAKYMHYPDCWDTAAYPTLESAMHENSAWFECSNQDIHTAPQPAQHATACKGMNCGCTNGIDHSLECHAEHAAAIAGGQFVKAPKPAQPKAEPHSDALSAFESAIRCGLAKPSDWPAYEQGYSQGRYDEGMLQGPPAEDTNKQLLEALKDARELVEHWAGYAGEYFRKKHDIDGDLARIDAAIAAAEGDKI